MKIAACVKQVPRCDLRSARQAPLGAWQFNSSPPVLSAVGYAVFAAGVVTVGVLTMRRATVAS